MYCRIKNIECPHAGEVKMNGSEVWGKEEGEIYTCTICYREGGRLACTLGI